MTANYEGLATELLRVQEVLLRQPDHQLLARLGQGEAFVLNYLLTHQRRAHPGELSRGLSVSTARIAALLGRMERKQLISRGPDPLNNRQVIVTLSPQGLEVIQRLRAQVLHTVVQMLAELGPEDAREFVRLQKKLLTHLAAPGPTV